MRFLLLIIMITGLIGQACEKKIDDANLPEHKEGFAVEAFLEKGKPAKVFIDKSVPIQKRRDTIDKGQATVTLHQDGKGVTELEYQKDGFYIGSTTIQGSQEYTVKVNGEELPKAEGTTEIPEQVKLETLKFDDSADKTPNVEIMHALTFKFKDPAGQMDYYSIQGIMIDSGKQQRIDLPSFDLASDFTYRKATYMTDNDFDGETTSLTVLMNGVKYDPAYVKEHFVFKFQHLSESMYNYVKSLSQQASAGGTGPFSGEPALSEGNVENGYGCVGGVAEDVGRVK